MKSVQRKCLSCGKDFLDPKHPNKKVCSKACEGMMRRKPDDVRKCIRCGSDFSVRPASKVRYCSIACFNGREERRLDFKRICIRCGNEYMRCGGNAGQKFCSVACAKSFKEVAKQDNLPFCHRANKTIRTNRKTAQDAYKRSFPACMRCGWNIEPTILHVHHRNRNRKDVSISNLEVLCPTCHVLEHFRAKDSIWVNIPG